MNYWRTKFTESCKFGVYFLFQLVELPNLDGFRNCHFSAAFLFFFFLFFFFFLVGCWCSLEASLEEIGYILGSDCWGGLDGCEIRYY
jgi:hypothetical protein